MQATAEPTSATAVSHSSKTAWPLLVTIIPTTAVTETPTSATATFQVTVVAI